MTADEIGDSVNDFYVKTKCFYLTDSSIEGLLTLKKDKMVFRSQTAHDYSNIQKLKQIDEELFEEEIRKIELHKEFESYIDYLDIHDVKLMVIESMRSSIEEIFPEEQQPSSKKRDDVTPLHDFHL